MKVLIYNCPKNALVFQKTFQKGDPNNAFDKFEDDIDTILEKTRKDLGMEDKDKEIKKLYEDRREIKKDLTQITDLVTSLI